MRIYTILFILLFPFLAFAQNQKFPELNNLDQLEQFTYKDGYIIDLTFTETPNKNQLKSKGNAIQLIQFLGGNKFKCFVPNSIEERDLVAIGCEEIHLPTIEEKYSPQLLENTADESSEIVVIFLGGTIEQEINALISKLQINGANFLSKNPFILQFEANNIQINQLANAPIIVHLDFAEETPSPLNFESTHAHGGRILGLQGLDGKGVVIGLGDGGTLGEHPDFWGRVNDIAPSYNSAYGEHPDKVAGILIGNGSLDPKHQGFAPKASILNHSSSLIFIHGGLYYDQYGMVVTNNSYGLTLNCTNVGTYNNSSIILDQQAHDYPKLLHCFAAGNSGNTTCGSFPTGYHTVLRAYQAAKNVLTVGNVNFLGNIYAESSRGPVSDGRIKPEIVATGVSVKTTGRNNNYSLGTGTSYASPAVAGTSALLIESYRENHDGMNPDAALIKAALCNSAKDKGNPGPDFSYGFGVLNGADALEILNNEQYFEGTINHNQVATYSLNIPNNVKKVKVMIYWADEPGVAYASTSLVNNIDLEMIDPTGNSWLPWVLNSAPANVEDNATRGVDELNNIEQITLDNPATGNYTLKIKGTNIPADPQSFYLVYSYERDVIKILSPVGNEVFHPGEITTIQWASFPSTDLLTLEYSIDNGASWQLINDNIQGTEQSYQWVVPNIPSTEVLVKVKQNTSLMFSTSFAPFTIAPFVTGVDVEAVCDGYFDFSWDALTDVAFYEIMKYDTTLKVIKTTTATSVMVEDPGNESPYWFAIRPVFTNGTVGEPSKAISENPATNLVCPWSNDVAIGSVSSYKRGRIYTSSALGTNEEIQVRFKNVGSNVITGVPYSIQLNNILVEDTLMSQLLPNNEASAKNYFNLQQTGNYHANIVTSVDGDILNGNNTVQSYLLATQLPNDPISIPFEQSFEGNHRFTVYESTLGLEAINRADFEGEGFVSTQNLYTIDGEQSLRIHGGQTNSAYFIQTFNLASHSVTEDLFMGFSYAYPTLSVDTANYVFIRGNDTAPWILASDLLYQTDIIEIDNINISELLSNNNQAFSGSFQIAFRAGAKSNYFIDQLSIYGSEGSLPIELFDFRASRLAEGVLLEWITATEIDNEIFEVQYSNSKQEALQGAFKTIGSVAGAGTSTQINTYNFLDQQATNSYIRYYRLKQIDFDGSFSFSPVIAVQLDPDDFKATPYPNPFYGSEFHLDIDNKSDTDAWIKVTDLSGKVFYESIEELSRGVSQVSVHLNETCPHGMYLVYVELNGVKKQYKVIKREF